MKWVFGRFIFRQSIFGTNTRCTFTVISLRTAVNLSFKIFGENPAEADAPPVLIFHGLLGNKKHWDSVGKTILSMTKRSVVSVDLRNHGDSPHANSHKYEDLADDITQLLKKLSLEKVSLVGHSMGGRACMCLSLIQPQVVAGMIVIDISPISTSRHLREFIPKLLLAMKGINFKGQKKVTNAKQEAKKHLKELLNDDVTMNAVLSNIRAKADHTIGWGCNLDVLIKHFKYIESFPKNLINKQFSGPSLFIGGQLSEYLPCSAALEAIDRTPRVLRILAITPLLSYATVFCLYSEVARLGLQSTCSADDLCGIREMFPRAVITYVPKTGHNLHADDPKTFLELAIAFLKTN